MEWTPSSVSPYLRSRSMPICRWVPSISRSIALPTSWRMPPRRATWMLALSSAAMVPARKATSLLDLLVELRLDLLDHLLDARRVDAAVGDEPLQGHPRHLAAEGVEAGED